MANFQGTKLNPTRFSRTQIKFYIVLIPISVFMIIPVLYIINLAFKPLSEMFAFPPTIFAKRFSVDNFRFFWFVTERTGIPMSRYLLNSIIVALVSVVLNMIVTIYGAYVLSKTKYKWKDTLMKINQMALMFVSVAVAVPRYMIITRVGLINNFWVHILPFLSMPVGLFLVKQFVDQLPDSLIESARIDGANEFTIVHKIIIPLTKSALATVAILVFQDVWTSSAASVNYITDDTLRTIPFFINSLSQNNAIQYQGLAAAGSLILFLPNLIIFLFMQSKVMSTMSHSGIKG